MVGEVELAEGSAAEARFCRRLSSKEPYSICQENRGSGHKGKLENGSTNHGPSRSP